ncbi:hypothetical protein BRD56_12335 [Thermoplasmatales archaeon SW_10_69_26]|nr:MAG: hypothetical protein BRD56_12335 [Thermoplasmatales archaeon SW_10_69_26]
MSRTAAWTVAALASLILGPVIPAAEAHAGAAIEVEAREGEGCVADPVCLELAALPVDLEPGHATALEVRVHDNASTSYRVAVTSLAEADPDREATPLDAAVAVTDRIAPGEEDRVNLTLPDAAEGYLWLPDGDQESRGGWEEVPIDPQAAQQADQRPSPGLGALAGVAVALAGGAARRQA